MLLFSRSQQFLLPRPPAIRVHPAYWQALSLRYNSSQVSQSPFTKHLISGLAAGVAGGGLVISAGYAWYHFSGLKSAVEASKSAATYLELGNKLLASNTKGNSSNAILGYIRTAAKSYVSTLPGAGIFVDKAFDSVDEVVLAHSDKANAIMAKMYREFYDVVRHNDGKSSVETSLQVLKILKRGTQELHALGMKASGGALTPLAEWYPGAREKVIGSFGELQGKAKSIIPSVEQIAEDAQQKIKGLLAPEPIQKVKPLVEGETGEIQKRRDGSDPQK